MAADAAQTPKYAWHTLAFWQHVTSCEGGSQCQCRSTPTPTRCHPCQRIYPHLDGGMKEIYIWIPRQEICPLLQMLWSETTSFSGCRSIEKYSSFKKKKCSNFEGENNVAKQEQSEKFRQGNENTAGAYRQDQLVQWLQELDLGVLEVWWRGLFVRTE